MRDYARPFVESGPLPPHERTWRHPSELAAEARREIRAERPTTAVRNVAIAGGTMTILLVGVAVLSLTPGPSAGPTATGSTPIHDRIGAVSLTLPSGDDLAAASRRPEAPRPPRATGLGNGGVAVVPSRSLLQPATLGPRSSPSDGEGEADVRGDDGAPSSRDGTLVTVTLGDGTTASAAIIDAGNGSGLAVVRLEPPHDALDGYAPAADLPHDHDLVTVMGDHPIEIELHRLDETDLGDDEPWDGVAVLDADGLLVGVVGDAPEGTHLITLDDIRDTLVALGALETPDVPPADPPVDADVSPSGRNAGDATTTRD